MRTLVLDRAICPESESKDPRTSQIIGAAIEVHRQLGPGLLESTYEECLCHELHLREKQFKRQISLPVQYKGPAGLRLQNRSNRRGRSHPRTQSHRETPPHPRSPTPHISAPVQEESWTPHQL